MRDGKMVARRGHYLAEWYSGGVCSKLVGRV